MFPVKWAACMKTNPVGNQVIWKQAGRLPGCLLKYISHASTHNLPALIDVAISHRNTIMAHKQGRLSTVSPQRSPLAKGFRCKRANCGLPWLRCSGLAQEQIHCRAFPFCQQHRGWIYKPSAHVGLTKQFEFRTSYFEICADPLFAVLDMKNPFLLLLLFV